jgi:DNA-binding winged helix-turn-helix (wHTH) protein
MEPRISRIARMLAFGPFTFDPANGLLRRADSEIPLPPRVLGVLAYLLARPGQVVARQDLIDAIWKDAFVTDTSLAEAVSSLRQALGDDPQQPVYIQTLHRRGYRFVAPLAPAPQLLEPDAATPGAPTLSPTHAPVVPSIAFQLLPWSLVAILGAVVIAAIWKIEYANPRPEPAAARFTVSFPAGTRLDDARPAIAIAQDGSRLAWSACETVRCGIWTRALDDLDAAFVDGSRGGRAPFFAPDARRIGFFAAGKLRTISLAGGTPLAIADADALGATWREDGQIVFAGGAGGGLSVVGENGGRVEPLTRPDPSAREIHVAPFHVPGTQAVVFTTSATGDRSERRAAIVETDGTIRTLVDDASGARVAVGGLLVFARGKELVGVAWDDRLRALAGAPAPLVADVDQFAVSGSGTLVLSGPDRLVVALEWAREARKRVPPGVGRIIR